MIKVYWKKRSKRNATSNLSKFPGLILKDGDKLHVSKRRANVNYIHHKKLFWLTVRNEHFIDSEDSSSDGDETSQVSITGICFDDNGIFKYAVHNAKTVVSVDNLINVGYLQLKRRYNLDTHGDNLCVKYNSKM